MRGGGGGGGGGVHVGVSSGGIGVCGKSGGGNSEYACNWLCLYFRSRGSFYRITNLITTATPFTAASD
jgi:hypothetical protein